MTNFRSPTGTIVRQRLYDPATPPDHAFVNIGLIMSESLRSLSKIAYIVVRTFAAFASQSRLSDGSFPVGSRAAGFDATIISLEIFVNNFARSASVLPFLRWIFAHFECPDIVSTPLAKDPETG